MTDQTVSGFTPPPISRQPFDLSGLGAILARHMNHNLVLLIR